MLVNKQTGGIIMANLGNSIEMWWNARNKVNIEEVLELISKKMESSENSQYDAISIEFFPTTRIFYIQYLGEEESMCGEYRGEIEEVIKQLIRTLNEYQKIHAEQSKLKDYVVIISLN